MATKRPPTRVFSDADRVVLKELQASGRPRHEMARKFGCSVNAISHQLALIRKSAVAPVSKATFIAENYEKIWDLHLNHNLAAKDIAVRLGFSENYTWVLRVLQDGPRPANSIKLKTLDELINTSVIGISWEDYQRTAALIVDDVWSRYYHSYWGVSPKAKRSFDSRGVRGHHLIHYFAPYDGYYHTDEDTDVVTPRAKPLPFKYLCHPANLELVKSKSPAFVQPDSQFEWPEVKNWIQQFNDSYGDPFPMCHLYKD